jgi:hypothetical protein
MKLEIWVDGSLEIMHVFFFSSSLPILKILVAMATNRLKTHKLDLVIMQKVKKIFL